MLNYLNNTRQDVLTLIDDELFNIMASRCGVLLCLMIRKVTPARATMPLAMIVQFSLY